MTTVLVANRGEIARRVIRTARRMGLRTAIAFSDADADAPATAEADVAVRLGPAPAAESYLAIPRILQAARETDAELLHPGYGFLSEDAAFADAVATGGLRFVGPPPAVLRSTGDKGAAKATAERAGVPVLPGYRGADQRDEAFAEVARAVGYPVMLKPAGGGGGIGMRLVAEAPALREALARARRAARAAFGDERLILESAVPRPRHVEVQILGDGTRLVAFPERDCSAQRRHQKLLEETTSPAVDDRLRTKLRDAALAVGHAVGYVNAGTVEFLVGEEGAFHFLEVNARLQVEHSVTEEVCGIDLVEQQLRVTLGERLALGPQEPSGHAIEARLYAEDPARDFAPSAGRLVRVRWPGGVRIDAGYEQGSTVTRHYDPLLAKIVARASDRAAAIEALARALDETVVLGVRTNRHLLAALVAHEATRAGRVDTELVERELPSLVGEPRETPAAAYALAAAALIEDARRSAPRDPWSSLGPWRLGAPPATRVALGERVLAVEGDGPYAVEGLAVVRADRGWRVDGRDAAAARDGTRVWIALDGDAYEIESEPRDRGVEAHADDEVVAPMPGVVLAVHARAGQRIARGTVLCVVEAMKMELRVEAPRDGLVRRVLCAPGDQVRRGQRLVELDGVA